MKKGLIVLLIGIFAGFSSASALTIRGTITDSDKQPLPSVEVYIKRNINGIRIGEVADFDGNYTISNDKININDKIIFNYAGYETEKSIPQDAENTVTINVSLNNMLDEVILSNVKNIEKVIQSQNRHIKGKVVNTTGYGIKNIGITIKEMNIIINHFTQSTSNLRDQIIETEKDNDWPKYIPNYPIENPPIKIDKEFFLSELQKKLKLAEDEKNDILNKTKKLDKKYYFLTNENGNFDISSKLLPKGIYEINLIDFSNKYKTVKLKKEFSSEQDIWDIGLVKMYTDCDDTGGSFDSDCLFPAWSTKSSDKESKRQEIRGVYGKNQDNKNALAIIPNIIDIILKFVSPIVVGMFIFAGIKFIYAGSDEEDITSAKDFFIYASIGLAFIIMSYTLMKVVYFFLK